ncbi:hypothetical protein Nepgr_011057 [Nepenthes gracilis]|uniref:VQ domain-containing protein n=1 Tax=Nepenthes gracilis TaxID=150966 RepID=A0AAD3SDN9_NEPGR|nr:hypothetical protein Nepgr_011057 [Nepenthes gracilis]
MESRNRPNEYLGVNKTGKNIRKSPLHQPNFVNSSSSNATTKPQPQPHVYNISKNDFRSIVQQLTGSPSQEPLLKPPSNPPKSPSMRLQKIRPPPLKPFIRPPIPPMIPVQAPVPPLAERPAVVPAQVPYGNNFAGPPPQFGQPSARATYPLAPTDSAWVNPALSPISAFMQQLQSCINDGGPRATQDQLHLLPQVSSQVQAQHQLQPKVMGQDQLQLPSSGLLPSPHMPPMPSPRMSGSSFLPSPTSQFFLPSPSGFLNLISPTPSSPYPLLSPGHQFPPSPFGQNFSFTPTPQPGILGPAPVSPISPGIGFPLSPSGFFPISSPRWRAQ